MGYLVFFLAVVNVLALVASTLFVHDWVRYARFGVLRAWYVGFWTVRNSHESFCKMQDEWNTIGVQRKKPSYEANFLCFFCYVIITAAIRFFTI
jgi:hypothetical protein